MASFGSADNQVHIANNTNEDIYIIAAPNPDWVWADVAINVAITVATTVATLGAGTAAASGSAVKSIKALQAATSAISFILEAANIGSIVKMGINNKSVDDAAKSASNVLEFLERNALKIEPRQYKKVFEVSNWDPQRYIGASGWGAVLGGSDCTLYVVTKSLTRRAMFNTNSDHSWVVKSNEVVRSEYGTLWKEDRAAGFYRFTRGDRLPMGSYLEPDEALISSNGDYNLVYRSNGDLVVTKRANETPIWNSKTDGKPAWRTYMQDDGNLVVYGSKGNRLWASNSAGSGGVQLVLKDNGILGIYNRDNKKTWDNNKRS